MTRTSLHPPAAPTTPESARHRHDPLVGTARSRRSRRLVMVGVVGASALALVACSSAHPSSTAASRPTTTPRTTTTTTPPTSTSTTTSPPSSTTTTVPAVTTCATSNLRVSLGPGSGAAGSSYYPLVFTNVGTSPCTLYGYPGVSAVTGADGTQEGAAASRVTGTTAPTTVTLAVNGTASALLRIVVALNYPAATCHPARAAGLRVYPPGDLTAAFVPEADLQVCTSTSNQVLFVGAVQAGSTPAGA